MSRFLLGFDTDPPAATADERSIRLSASGAQANVRARFQSIHDASVFSLPNAVDDLLAIAAYCLEADKEMLRGTPNDIWLRDWKRDISIRAAVSAYEVWTAPGTRECLEEYLGFLTGDSWHFEFVAGRQSFQASTLFPGLWQQSAASVDSVLLFSGGLDSLACYLLEAEGQRSPILVSHTPTGVISTAQTNLLSELQRLPSPLRPPHVAFYSAHRNPTGVNSNNLRQESTQRTRGFLYATMGLAVMAGHGLDRLVLADNGIVSLNLATLRQSLLARNSRATHPKSLFLFGELAQRVIGKHIHVDNPLRFNTRTEIIETVERLGGPACVDLTRSCSRQRGLTSSQPFCGTCSQCIDRRLGALMAGSTGDQPQRYVMNILEAPLTDYRDRMQALSYVAWAREVNKLDDTQLFDALPDLAEVMALPNLDLPQDGPEYVRLLKRHAGGVVVLMDRLVGEANLVSSDLPDTAFLRLVAGKRDVDPRADMIDELRRTFATNLVRVSNWGKWKDEKEAQHDVDAVLNTWSQGQFDAESPQLPFAGISAKPDFSKNFDAGYLYVEVKYPQTAARRREIIKEITSRFVVYQNQGAYALFLVLDPKGIVTEREKMLRLADGQAGCWMGLVI